jgi:hypothetical protein
MTNDALRVMGFAYRIESEIDELPANLPNKA